MYRLELIILRLFISLICLLMGNGACGDFCPGPEGKLSKMGSAHTKYLQENRQSGYPNHSISKSRIPHAFFDDSDEENTKGFGTTRMITSDPKSQSQKRQSQSESLEKMQQENEGCAEKLVKICKVGFGGSDLPQDITIEGANDYEPLKVPFAVIKLSLSDKFLGKIRDWDYKFMDKYSEQDRMRPQWILVGQGCYASFLKSDFGTFITNKELYVGHFLRVPSKNNFYLPHDNGIYLTEDSMYQGQFHEGEANGKGRLTLDDTVYKGKWENGVLSSGIIDSPIYSFHGTFKDRVPQGDGVLKIKTKGITYEGKFKSGLFHDDHALYDCIDYSYKGGFSEGKKNGQGVLTEKDKPKQHRSFSKDKKKYKPPLKLRGLWSDDIFLPNNTSNN